MAFYNLYLPLIIFAFIVSIFRASSSYKYNKFSANVALLIGCFIFSIIAFRTSGADWGTYYLEYNSFGVSITDPGYVKIMQIFKSLNLPFSFFILCCNLIIFYSLVRTARIFQVSLIVVVTIYLLHLFIVRDLAHMRVSLAVAFFLLSLQRNLLVTVLFYLIGISIHISILPLIAAMIAANFLRDLVYRFFYFSLLAVLLLAFVLKAQVSWFIENIVIIDPRIAVYSKMADPINGSFGYAALIYFLLLTLYIKQFDNGEDNAKVFSSTIVVNLIALAFYVSFGDLPEIGPRIFNVLMSFYPIQLAYTIDNFQPKGNFVILKSKNSLLHNRSTRIVIFFLFLVPLVLRNGNQALIDKVTF